ncbi:MAG: hypothetical protein ACOC1F_04775 [Myxococcota bacterium]
MKSRIFCLAVPAALLLCLGCSDDQSVDPGSSGGEPAVLDVSYDGQSVPVDLGDLATTPYEGVELVKLSDVWAESGITADRAALAFEFVASDGFKPSNKDCEDLAGTNLDQGYIDPVSRNLTWDESLGLGGCYAVRDTVEMNAHLVEDDGMTDAGTQ